MTATSQITSSVSQLLFGYLTDRRSLPVLIPVGCVLSGAGLALTALVPGYAALLGAIAISGLGVAAFHPEAARSAARVSGAARATGMSIFSVGGNVGFALGPLAVAALAPLLRSGGTLSFLVPAVVVGAVTWPALRGSPLAGQAAPSKTRPASHIPRAGRAMAFLTLITILRSVVQVSLLTFVPLYEVAQLGRPESVASSLLTVFLAAGAAGTLVSGVAADRWGRKAVVVASFAAGSPLLLLFSRSDGIVAYVALAGVGLALLSTFAVTIVMGQELMPHRTGVASALVIGFASGVGGAAVGLFGHLADDVGPGWILQALAVVPLLAALCSLGLVEPSHRREVSVPATSTAG